MSQMGAIDDYNPASFAPATTVRDWVQLPLGLDSDLELPLITVRGAQSGPTALLVAGVHGDEFEGVATLSSFADRLDPKMLHGTVIALPVCNRWAFSGQLRATPPEIDGTNLARAFPGDPGGTPTARLAFALFSLATRLLSDRDLVVDLHSAGARYRYLTLAGFRDVDSPVRAASERAARSFAAGAGARLWLIPDGKGMFNAETTRAGIPTIGAEAPGQGECRLDDVRRYEEGLLNVLRHQQMLPGDVITDGADTARLPSEILAPADGIFVSYCATGETVSQGDPLGRIIDTIGATRSLVIAPRSGEIWALRTFASIYRGELVAWIA